MKTARKTRAGEWLAGRVHKAGPGGREDLAAAGLRARTERLIGLVQTDPFASPPPYERLVGELSGAYSRRINIKHRLVHEVFVGQQTVRVLRMWTHYE